MSQQNGGSTPERAKTNNFWKMGCLVVVVILAVVLARDFVFPSSQKRYEQAQANLNNGSYDKAMAAFAELGVYEDSPSFLQYAQACKDLSEENYSDAYNAFEALENFKDSKKYLQYTYARYSEATKSLSTALSGYEYLGDFLDCKARAKACQQSLLDDYYDSAYQYQTMRNPKRASYETAIALFI